MLSTGLNPSLTSARDGLYIANPRSRFWRALNASGLVAEELEPGVDAVSVLFEKYRIGFTDVVKRATAGGGELRAADYREWAPLLQDRLLEYSPCIAWFHGKQAYANYLKYALNLKPVIHWGEQPQGVGNTCVFVSPNPSPANAVYSLDDLVGWYRQLADMREQRCRQAVC